MKQSPSSAPALDRGLRLLEQLAVDGQASLEALSARNEWPKSSVLRCLKTLEILGAAQQDPVSRRWRALQRMQKIDTPALPPLEHARKQLPLLAQQTGHCAELYGFSYGELTLIDRAEPESRDILIRARIGFNRDLRELDATALLVYAFCPDCKIPRRMWNWEKGEKKTLTSKKVRERVREAKASGSSADADFNEYGIRRFAVPVFQNADLVGILAVAQRQTHRADAEIEFITQTLQPQNEYEYSLH